MFRCPASPCLFFFLLILFCPFAASGDDTLRPATPVLSGQEVTSATEVAQPAVRSPEVPALLPVVTVTGEEIRPPGEVSRSGEDLRSLPQGNGTLNELLRTLPGIQLSEQARRSTRGGEILSPEISISGGRFFQNQYLIDGVSVTSKLDPAEKDARKLDDVPGHSLFMFIEADLIESVTVYEHSVPARLGDFTGGVVEVETRDPGPQFGGRLHYRTTRDSWTRFHLPDEEKDAFENSRTETRQPRFEKHQEGIELNLPLGARSGLLAAYQRIDSRIPLQYDEGGSDKDQRRRLEHIFLKYLAHLPGGNTLRLSYNATPYEGEHFTENSVNSEFTVRSGGETVNLEFDHAGTGGILHLQAAYADSENSRDAPDRFYNWKITDSRPWGKLFDASTSREGGFGDLDKTQQDLQFTLDFTSLPIRSGAFSHTLNTGFDLYSTEASFERKKSLYSYGTAELSAVVECAPGDETCVDGEQYFSRRNIYPAERAEADLNQFAYYLEDRIDVWRLTLRLGLRYSYDNYLGNAHIAPRFSTQYDLFGNARTVFFGGLNRYYGQTLVTDKLREAKTPFVLERRALGAGNLPGDWTFASTSINVNSSADLDTPYTDEYALGIDQALWGGRLILEGIQREGRDEIASEVSPTAADGFRHRTFNNNGRSRYRSAKMSWGRDWPRISVDANITWQETETNAADYDVIIDDEALASAVVWSKGEEINRADLPREDFNRSWVGNLTLVWRLPWGFTFTNFTQYRSGYDVLADTGKNYTLESGEKIDIYEEAESPESWVFDWKLEWRRNLTDRQQVALTLEALNVFNEKVPVENLANWYYETGRQVWAGAEYRF